MKQITREWLAFLREQYPVGSRIRLNSMEDPYAPVEPGTMGTLQRIDDAGQFLMKWDNGRTLSLIPGEDSFSLILPEPTMMKLYMPLHADLYTKDDWSDTSEEPEMLTGRALMEYEDSILIALIKNRMSEEAERGIMRWYGREDSVDRKVKSVVFTAEEREGQLWGVAECKVVGELTPEELDTLKDYISGQASDGWGEGFEQREIQVDDGARKAGQKGIRDSLVIVDDLAFIVNVPNKTVVTAMNSRETEENVFTNINGAVIM